MSLVSDTNSQSLGFQNLSSYFMDKLPSLANSTEVIQIESSCQISQEKMEAQDSIFDVPFKQDEKQELLTRQPLRKGKKMRKYKNGKPKDSPKSLKKRKNNVNDKEKLFIQNKMEEESTLVKDSYRSNFEDLDWKKMLLNQSDDLNLKHDELIQSSKEKQVVKIESSHRRLTRGQTKEGHSFNKAKEQTEEIDDQNIVFFKAAKYRFKIPAFNRTITTLLKGLQEKVNGKKREDLIHEQPEALVLPGPTIPVGSKIHQLYVSSLKIVLKRRKYVYVEDE